MWNKKQNDPQYIIYLMDMYKDKRFRTNKNLAITLNNSIKEWCRKSRQK